MPFTRPNPGTTFGLRLPQAVFSPSTPPRNSYVGPTSAAATGTHAMPAQRLYGIILR